VRMTAPRLTYPSTMELAPGRSTEITAPSHARLEGPLGVRAGAH
jgi:hypothetical protein